jgi:ferredoxin
MHVALQEAGVELPNLCRNGTCCTCAVKIESGTANRSETNYLDQAQLDKGFMLVCSAFPTSDLVLTSHQEENLW